ncbi:MAG: hypothetical protein ABW039_09090 [Sphingobium sp.]
MLALSYDEDMGLVRLISSGMVTLDEVEAYRVELIRIVDVARRHTGRVLMYVDSTQSTVQTQAAIDALATIPSIAVGPRDRMAVVIHSVLGLLQVKRAMRNDQERAFITEAEAMAWLIDD